EPPLYELRVHAMKDGRFGAADFTLWPQIYDCSSSHFAFVLRHPGEGRLSTHKLAFLWYNLSRGDYQEDSTCVVERCGRLREDLAREFRNKAFTLRSEIQ
ncbi:hypothetical protein C8J56DRAFT_740734, partial [Mycena floridula]